MNICILTLIHNLFCSLYGVQYIHHELYSLYIEVEHQTLLIALSTVLKHSLLVCYSAQTKADLWNTLLKTLILCTRLSS